MSYTPSSDQYPDNRRVYADAPTDTMAPPPDTRDYPPPRIERPVERVVERPVEEPVMQSEPRSSTLGRLGQFIYILLGALDALLIIRFALKLLAANPDAGFTSFIYGLTQLFVAPFQGVFPSPQTHSSVLEVSTLLAIIVYALLAWLIVSAFGALLNRWPSRGAY
ncbi:MAG TPA: YggT family protein [Ktedonobacterales bacterium]